MIQGQWGFPGRDGLENLWGFFKFGLSPSSHSCFVEGAKAAKWATPEIEGLT